MCAVCGMANSVPVPVLAALDDRIDNERRASSKRVKHKAMPSWTHNWVNRKMVFCMCIPFGQGNTKQSAMHQHHSFSVQLIRWDAILVVIDTTRSRLNYVFIIHGILCCCHQIQSILVVVYNAIPSFSLHSRPTINPIFFLLYCSPLSLLFLVSSRWLVH